MADHNPSGDRVAKEWPLEGHLIVGGSGLFVTTDCLGRAFASRTASYDLTIGLPQLDPGSTSYGRLLPPEWTIGPSDERERANERDAIDWGIAYTDTAQAVVVRCRFYTTLTASDDKEFICAEETFMDELMDWWTNFTSWLDLLASQDLKKLGRSTRRGITGPDLEAWTSDSHGRRAEKYEFSPNERRASKMFRFLELRDLEACVTAAGNQDPPPADWLFIRDARSLLNGRENRRAVIDAATAAELAMTTLIDQYLATSNTDEPVRTALVNRYKALEGRAALLRRLRSRFLSDQLQRDLIEPRNVATHRGNSLTDAQAQTAVDMAADIVEKAYPLASLLPT